MSTCDFKLAPEMINEYAERYMRLLYRNEYEGNAVGTMIQTSNSPLKQMAHSVANDACYTYCNLVFST